jgi:hypothetical protein
MLEGIKNYNMGDIACIDELVILVHALGIPYKNEPFVNIARSIIKEKPVFLGVPSSELGYTFTELTKIKPKACMVYETWDGSHIPSMDKNPLIAQNRFILFLQQEFPNSKLMLGGAEFPGCAQATYDLIYNAFNVSLCHEACYGVPKVHSKESSFLFK